MPLTRPNKVWGVGLRVLAFRVLGLFLGFRVLGLGFRVHRNCMVWVRGFGRFWAVFVFCFSCSILEGLELRRRWRNRRGLGRRRLAKEAGPQTCDGGRGWGGWAGWG